MKKVLALVIVFCLVSTLFLVENARGTEAIGRITQNTTWTKSQSPITLTGPVNVNKEVTLTIEPGVTVNLNNYYIQVEGTLRSVGSSSDQIRFDNGKITIKDTSNGWNPQTGTGDVFENSLLNNVTIYASNPLSSSTPPAIKFNHNTLNGEISVAGASIVTSNTVIGTIGAGGTTIVWKNMVTGSIGGGGLGTTSQKHPIISCNTVTGGAGYINSGIGASAYVQIEDNTVSGCNYGIFISTGSDVMGGCVPPNAVIERNRITDCTHGIHAEIYNAMATKSGTPTVKTNSLSNNKIGLYVDGWAQCLTLKNNNIKDCSEYRVYLKSSNDLDATQNWWGTTDNNAIRQSIYDGNQDFNLGTVTFEPILTAENAAAYPNQNAPMPTPQTSSAPNPTAQPTQQTATPTSTDKPTLTPTISATDTGQPTFSFDLEVATFAALIVVIALLTVLIALVLRKRNPKLPPPPPPS